MDATNRFRNPDYLITLAAEGRLPKQVLAALLEPASRGEFLDRCARIERGYTDACIARRDPCLESGCSIADGEICLQPILAAGIEYDKACGAAWIELFRSQQARETDWPAAS